MQENEIRRGRINSEKEKQREQELWSGINEFHLEGISVKWQLLSSAFTAVLEKLIGGGWRRKISPLSCHRLMCQFVRVYAEPESSVQIPSGTGRKETLACQKAIIHKDGASSGVVGLHVALPPHSGFAESHLMNVAQGFNNGLVLRWSFALLQCRIF